MIYPKNKLQNLIVFTQVILKLVCLVLWGQYIQNTTINDIIKAIEFNSSTLNQEFTNAQAQLAEVLYKELNNHPDVDTFIYELIKVAALALTKIDPNSADWQKKFDDLWRNYILMNVLSQLESILRESDFAKFKKVLGALISGLSDTLNILTKVSKTDVAEQNIRKDITEVIKETLNSWIKTATSEDKANFAKTIKPTIDKARKSKHQAIANFAEAIEHELTK